MNIRTQNEKTARGYEQSHSVQIITEGIRVYFVLREASTERPASKSWETFEKDLEQAKRQLWWNAVTN